MKIEQNLFMNIFSASSRKDTQPKATDMQSETRQEGEIKLSIQADAKELAVMVEQLNKEETVREAKIEAIRAQLEAGTYKVTGAEVISRMIGGY